MKYQYFEVCEHVAVHAAHHGHELGGELEGGALEAEVLGRAGEDEAVVDVDEVTLAVQEDIAVVTILHLDTYMMLGDLLQISYSPVVGFLDCLLHEQSMKKFIFK